MLPTIPELYDLSHTLAAEYLAGFTHPWEALPGLGDFLKRLEDTLPQKIYEERAPHVFVAKDALVAPTAYLGPHTIVGPGAEIRHCAYLRGNALIGAGATVGNSTEIKNAILFDKVQVPHYNYVGDSILGYAAHMGAGAIASNFRSDKGSITVHGNGEDCPTGLRKLGAMLGDFAEVGCNSVLCPGSIVGRSAVVYPLSRVRGIIPEKTIYKGEGRPIPRLTSDRKGI